jgi:hypothetical protein
LKVTAKKGLEAMNSSETRKRNAEERQPRQLGNVAADVVARRAYDIWQSHGCPSGTATADWLRAEAELQAASRVGRCEKPHSTLRSKSKATA